MHKKISVAVIILLIGIFGAYNWWNYFKGQHGIQRKGVSPSPVKADTSSINAGSAPSGKITEVKKDSTATPSKTEEEPVKRVPLKGELGDRSPFYNPNLKRETKKKSQDIVMARHEIARNNTQEITQVKEDYSLELIMIEKDGRRIAAINGGLYRVGDSLGNAKVVAIERESVILEDNMQYQKVLTFDNNNKRGKP